METPTHVAGFQIHTGIEFGVFGRSYVGFHSQEGRRILKILRDGEDLSVPDEEHAKLREDASLLHFEPRQQTQEGQRVLVAHFYQAASFGLLVQGCEIQKGCEKTLRELDPNGECATSLRGTTLIQRVELLKQLAQRVEKLHADKKTFPYVTPWNVMLADGRPKLVDVGLGFQPEKLDPQQVPEDVLAYFAPEVLRAIAEKKAIQVGPAADVYAFGLTARSILLERVVEVEGVQAAAPAPAAAPGAPAPAAPLPSGMTKREALLAGKGWRRAPQEKISRKLDDLLARAASREASRRPTASQLVKELEAILRDKTVAWTPPSPLPKIVGAAVLVLVLVGVVVLLAMPSPLEHKARVEYAKATNAASARDRLESIKKLEGELKLPSEKGGVLPEAERLKAATLLEDVAASPQAAIEALRAYAARPVPGNDADPLAARFIAAFVQRWAFFEATESRKELEAIAAANVTDPSGKQIPALAAAALKVAPFGVEGDLKPEDAKKWLEEARAARGDDQALKRSWPAPSGYEKIQPAPRSMSYKADWIAKLLLGRLKGLTGDDPTAELKESAEAFPTWFSTSGAWALHVARTAKDDAGVEAARAALGAALKLKKDSQTFGEGSLALAELAFRGAPTSKDGPFKAFKEAQKAYDLAARDKAATAGVDLTPACARGHLLAGFQIGAAVAAGIAKDPTAAADQVALREAENALQEFLEAADKDAKNAELQALVPDARVAMGLVLMVQEKRLSESYEHLAYVYVDGEFARGYRKADNPANAAVSKVFFEACKKELSQLLAADRPEPEKALQVQAKIDALCKLEKFDVSFLPIASAQFHRKAADGFKGKKRIEALNAARSAFESVFSSSADAWAQGLEGRVEATLTLAKETEDSQAAGALVTDAQQFLDKVPESLKARKITGKEADKAVKAQLLLVRKEWFGLLGKWLAARGDSTELNEQDQELVKTILAVAEGPNAPELDPAAKGQVARVHYLLGKWSYDQKKWTEAVTHLGLAVDNLPDDQKALLQQAALLAADIAMTRPGDVRPEEAPWRGGAPAATTWGRDLLAKRLGFPTYRNFIDAVRAGKVQMITDEVAAKRLVDDIIKNEASVSAEDLGLAAQIYSKSAKAQLFLARAKNAAGQKDEARKAAKTAIELSDAQTPEITVEAASVYCATTPRNEVSSSEFKAILDKALAVRDAAVAKWKGDAKLKWAFVPIYWLGRYWQQVADDAGGASDAAKKAYTDAEKAYRDYDKATTEAGADRPPECTDAKKRADNCEAARNG